jgi:hypothetical protein
LNDDAQWFEAALADPASLATRSPALWLQSLLFAVAHIENLGVHHAAWNFTIILTGLPLSGLGDWIALAPIASREATGTDKGTGSRGHRRPGTASEPARVSRQLVARWGSASDGQRTLESGAP